SAGGSVDAFAVAGSGAEVLAGAPVLTVGCAVAAVASASDPTSLPTGGVVAGSAKPQSSNDAPCIHCRLGCWVPCIIVTTSRRPFCAAIPTKVLPASSVNPVLPPSAPGY